MSSGPISPDLNEYRSSEDAIFSIDPAGVITSWNGAAEQMLGYAPPEILGHRSTVLVPAEHHGTDAEQLARIWSAVVVRHFDTALIHKNGNRVAVSLTVSPIRDASGMVIGASKIARDMRPEKHAEMAPLHLAAIVASSDDAIVSKDLNGIVTSWNRAAERLFGFTADEIIGRSITTIIPSSRLSEEDFVLGRVRAGLAVDHFETVRQRKDGSLVEISLTVSPIRDTSGTVIGASKIARDISEQRRLRDAQRIATASAEAARREVLEAQNRRIRESSRLKTEFVSNMSHELRTPLNSLIGFAEMIVDERFGPIAPKYQEFARLMLASGQHLLELMNDILDLAKIEAGRIDLRPEPVDIAALAGEVTAVVAGLAANRGIALSVDVAPEVRDAYLDPARLKQVLYNYLSNAIKFSHDDGRVTIRARAETDGRFRLEVIDAGVGINAEDLPRLFVDFQQLDGSASKRFPGTGLGLALTKRIVEAQGGAVGVDSAPGVGSTFFAILPRVVGAAAAHVGSERAPA